MKLKVCGLNDVSNIKEVLQLQPDFVGFIFYEKSPRNCTVQVDLIKSLNVGEIKKVGVFVNEPLENLLQIANDYRLDYVQLHGNESPEYCQQIKGKGVRIIKAFSVDDTFDMKATEDYQFCEYFLFDTKGENPGGNGTQFNWEILKKYKGTVPFILSGGLELKHSNSLNEIKNVYPLLSVLDINSKFEIKPGLKKINQVEEFINEIKMNKHV